MVAKEIAYCIQLATSIYDVPEPLLQAIMEVEGGRPGFVRENTNGSFDYGRMQINSLWVPVLAKDLKVDESIIAEQLKNNDCFNIAVGARILSGHMSTEASLERAIGHYHSRTPKHRDRYLKKVVEKLRGILGYNEKQVELSR